MSGLACRPAILRFAAVLVWALALATSAHAQRRAVLTGRVVDQETDSPLAGVIVSLEGEAFGTVTDSVGHYRLEGVPPGPQVLVATRIGYANLRVPLTLPTMGVVVLDIELATSALRMEGITVTADAISRARGELGTASVIEQNAIDVQTATSLSGLLELIPGIELRPPGLDDVEQISLRAAPTSSIVSLMEGGTSAAQLAAFGTLIVLDGVPMSNNANLQSTGLRGRLRLPSSAGGGIDLRRIPATTLERVEVIRGVPSVRFGDLSQGVIVVDTRAGAFEPRAEGIFDPHTIGGSFVGGWGLATGDALSATFDLTGTRPNPGFDDNRAVRISSQVTHRTRLGSPVPVPPATGNFSPRVTMDSRLTLFQVVHDIPEDPVVAPGFSSRSRDRGFRLSERARASFSPEFQVEFTGALDVTQQRSFVQSPNFRGASPFTERLTEGRSTGRFLAGEFWSRVDVDGDVWQIFSRLEADRRGRWPRGDQRLRAGVVLRREWNSGPGYRFDVEFPPQVTFNGVEGFRRPHRFDDLEATATSAFYLDQRVAGAFGDAWSYEVQGGLRLDLLHEGGQWVSGVRDGVLQPRLNVQVSPRPWLRVRAGAGQTAKQPALAQMSPAPRYFDVVNVNWFAPARAERLAILTTFIRDIGNADLGFSRTLKAEAGVEISGPGRDYAISLTAFRDRTTGGVGIRYTPTAVLRERYALADSTLGTGVPPRILEPPVATDSIPVLLDISDNILTLESRGLELTARLPEFRMLRTRLDIQGALIKTELVKEGLDFGTRFGDFQLDWRVPRAPYWESVTRTGTRGLLTYRVVHHQPALGLVITGTLQHFALERTRNVAGTDTLAWQGYVTRGGTVVPVAEKGRGRPEFADLRTPRTNVFASPEEIAPDWLLGLQLSLDLPLDGRLSLWAFNALDRPGSRGTDDLHPRFLPALRFGLEGAFRLGWLLQPNLRGP